MVWIGLLRVSEVGLGDQGWRGVGHSNFIFVRVWCHSAGLSRGLLSLRGELTSELRQRVQIVSLTVKVLNRWHLLLTCVLHNHILIEEVSRSLLHILMTQSFLLPIISISFIDLCSCDREVIYLVEIPKLLLNIHDWAVVLNRFVEKSSDERVTGLFETLDVHFANRGKSIIKNSIKTSSDTVLLKTRVLQF